MIDCADIPNWTRWSEKEQRGVNRGYSQAYINTERADHFVLLSESDLSFKNEFKVIVKPYTNGDWKPDWSAEETETFKGTPDESETLWEDAEAFARDWMLDHPCDRDDDAPRDAVELLTDILSAMRDEGLVPQHDCKVKGWARPGHMDSTSHNVRAFAYDEDDETSEATEDIEEANILNFHVRVDGKASGLSYKEETRYDSDGESRRHHEPRRQEKLHSNIEAAFRAVGFEAVNVKNGGYQTHWDHSTGYRVHAFIPEEMALKGPEKTKTRRRRRVF